MTKDPKPPPADIEIDVVNPRYEGATPDMVVRALLRRPKRADQEVSPKEPTDGSAPDDAHSPI